MGVSFCPKYCIGHNLKIFVVIKCSGTLLTERDDYGSSLVVQQVKGPMLNTVHVRSLAWELPQAVGKAKKKKRGEMIMIFLI